MAADLSGRVALVTGAASGIGRSTALAFAAEGADVVLCDLNSDGLDETQKTISAASPDQRIATYCVDVGDSAQVNSTAESVHAEFGALDVLSHCAGITGVPSPAIKMSDEDWHHTVANNLYSGFYLARAFAPPMLERRRGTMAYMASDNALYGRANNVPYSASKGGLISLVRSLALEFGPFNVTINAINPGATNTPLSKNLSPEARKIKEAADPLGKMNEPENIAQIMVFLAKEGGVFMTGQLITTRMVIRP